MSPLDELDLTLKLKRKEQSLRLAAGGARLQQSAAQAIDDMLERTDLPAARWTLVEGESSKRYARVKVMETVVTAIEAGCAARGFHLPAPLEATRTPG